MYHGMNREAILFPDFSDPSNSTPVKLNARLTPGYPSSGLSIPLQGLGLKFCAFDFTNQAPRIQHLNWIYYIYKGATVT